MGLIMEIEGMVRLRIFCSSFEKFWEFLDGKDSK